MSRSAPWLRWVSLVVAMVLAPVSSMAQRRVRSTVPYGPDVDPRSQSTLWDYARDPSQRETEQQLQAAEAMLRSVEDPRIDREQRRIEMQRVRSMLQRLIDNGSRHPLVLLQLAEVLDRLDASDAALPLLLEAQPALAQRPERTEVLFRLGVVYTRLHRFTDARDVYEEYLTLPADPRDRTVATCNLADTYVLLEDLPRAIDTYSLCLRAAPDYTNGWWGLAVANDRDGREPEAREAALQALARDPTFESIEGEGIFYIPTYDLHYYLGLAHEIRGNATQALEHWQRFLALGGDRGPFAARARAHVARLTAQQRVAANHRASSQREVRRASVRLRD